MANAWELQHKEQDRLERLGYTQIIVKMEGGMWYTGYVFLNENTGHAMVMCELGKSVDDKEYMAWLYTERDKVVDRFKKGGIKHATRKIRNPKKKLQECSNP